MRVDDLIDAAHQASRDSDAMAVATVIGELVGSRRLQVGDVADLIERTRDANAYQLGPMSADALSEAARVLYRLDGAHRVPEVFGKVLVLGPPR